MDIDSLSIDERMKLMKDGKCFICQRTGYMAKDHKKKLKERLLSKLVERRDTEIQMSGNSQK